MTGHRKEEAAATNGVKVGAWQMLWNAKPHAGRLSTGIPPLISWASDPNATAPVGCVCTAQGPEFDCVGAIWGRDLTGDAATNAWLGNPGDSHDAIAMRPGDRFTDIVKRTSRVLLRGRMDGCYVHVQDYAAVISFRGDAAISSSALR